MTLTRTARQLGLGKLALRLWHRPFARLMNSVRNGGLWAERETERQRREMEATAATLPPFPTSSAATAPALHLLTGKRFWYQTAFCLHSFARQAGSPINVYIYDDGTLDEETAGHLTRMGARVHAFAATQEKLERYLPVARFPVLRERWLNYPNLRKLIDPHLGSSGWKLAIDSDLLFFRRPKFILDWLAAPDRPLHAVDCTESYGYSRPLMERLAGAPIPPDVNVGLCGLCSDALDWTELEAWCAELIARERTNYYLEQALVAMLVARQPCAVAPVEDYITKPTGPEARQPCGVMHHYVAESKRWYFRENWRRVMSPSS